jgi:predicted dehydrogenase
MSDQTDSGRKLRIGVVGLGKMGLSHFSIVNAHPLADTVICDTTKYLTDTLGRYISNPIYNDVDRMFGDEDLGAVVVATPSKYHADIVRKAIDRKIAVFCEKPLCLTADDSLGLAEEADAAGIVNQVGYHYRYVGAFQEMQRVLASGALGQVTHAKAEAYGPVVLKPKRTTWRTSKAEGGGCLYDYAAHPINLLNWYFGRPAHISGTVLNSIFSADTDDEVYATFQFEKGPTAQLSVNWSDESHRKMSTSITAIGTGGRIFADRQECRVYLREEHPSLPGYKVGWNVRYTTDLTRQSWFYLRGEEYSNQMDDFITAAATGAAQEVVNDFSSAAMTDETISRIFAGGDAPAPQIAASTAQEPRSWLSRALQRG